MSDARIDGKAIVLTSAANDQTGAVWFHTPIMIGSSFCCRFQFRVSSTGESADGFAFVMQKESNRAIGQSGGGLGYAGIENGIAVEFDTYRNFDINQDPDNNHIAVMSSLSSQLSSHHKSQLSSHHNGALACTSDLPFRIADGNVHTAQILCADKKLHVFVDDLENPLLSCQFPESNSDIDNTFFVGFTGSTGGLNQENCILNWSFSTGANVQAIIKLTRETQLAENVQESKVAMCCEDDGNVATLHCDGCKDNYCKDCFERQHAKKWKDHKTTNIGNLSAKSASTCSSHGHPLDKFCQTDQVACCYQCFESGEHEGHQSTYISHVTAKIDTQTCEKLAEIDKQIQQLKQTIRDISKLKEKTTELHIQYTVQVKDSFNHLFELLEKKRDTLVAESEKMEKTTLSNILLQEQALTSLLDHKAGIVAQANKWLSENDFQADRCKKMLEKNRDIIAPMLICCESGDVRTQVDVSSVEQVIDKFASIVNEPVNFVLPKVTGFRESKRDENSVTLQWDSVKCDLAQMQFIVKVIFCRNPNGEDEGVPIEKKFQVPSNVTHVQIPIESWKSMQCIVYCAIGDQIQGDQGDQGDPLILYFLTRAEILEAARECFSRSTFKQLKSVFKGEIQELDLSESVDASNAPVVLAILPHLTQIQHLNLGNNGIDDSDLDGIFSGISTLTKLQSLSLSNNKITGYGATLIARGISNLKNLKMLSLRGNPIGDTGAAALSEATSKLPEFEKLMLDECDLGDYYVNNVDSDSD